MTMAQTQTVTDLIDMQCSPCTALPGTSAKQISSSYPTGMWYQPYSPEGFHREGSIGTSEGLPPALRAFDPLDPESPSSTSTPGSELTPNSLEILAEVFPSDDSSSSRSSRNSTRSRLPSLTLPLEAPAMAVCYPRFPTEENDPTQVHEAINIPNELWTSLMQLGLDARLRGQHQKSMYEKRIVKRQKQLPPHYYIPRNV
eukprot:CAMPEP_0206433178 /NCGR_PEP_ID=MMETSP0324_2-20121206/8380_1 /ASSEMBLY_ACC=CAM_ASM_000836 /TAXON_ID=2866 /ORGANISM="Crypthecodinium cohnii, Strain Seligo" /LENGTH=199 /DNA_ID=CAMNT_0053899397 /DNA_START=193 /DNA_END=792 /DNA_ORIENTATION=+